MFEGVSNLSSIGDAGTHHGYGSGWKLGNTYSQKEQSDISTDAQGVVGSMVVFQNHGHVALKDVAIGTVGVGRDPEVHLVAHTGLCREVRLQSNIPWLFKNRGEQRSVIMRVFSHAHVHEPGVPAASLSGSSTQDRIT